MRNKAKKKLNSRSKKNVTSTRKFAYSEKINQYLNAISHTQNNFQFFQKFIQTQTSSTAIKVKDQHFNRNVFSHESSLKIH